MKHIFLLLALSAVFFSCTQDKVEHVERAFYYWKSDTSYLTEAERTILDTVKVRKMYVKLFEVKHDEVMGNIPFAKSSLGSYEGLGVDSILVIPTVYIENDVFIKSSVAELDTLAVNMAYLVNKNYKERFSLSGLKEIQMDCDWTPKSRDNYFYFLKALKKEAKTRLSCTLRLYPYKYPDKMGVPPVDSAMLMCYNLVNPLNNEEMNSILDNKELSLYLDGSNKYPLHLDVALPVFSWMQVYQNKQFKQLVYLKDDGVKKVLLQVKPLWYEVKKDTLLDDIYLRKGDLIKYEEVTQSKLQEAISIIKKNVQLKDTVTVALYNLDENQLSKFSYETLNSFYSTFSK